MSTVPQAHQIAIAPPSTASRREGFAECHRLVSTHRSGGFLFSAIVDDRLGSWVAAAALKVGAHPTLLTLCNLILGLGGSAAVLVARPHATTLMLVGVVLWQVAYLFDCADGQLARTTGKTSPYGASTDVLVDMAVQASVVVALGKIVMATSGIPASLVLVFTAVWFVNFVTFVVAKTNGASSGPRLRRLLSPAMLLRDYGFVVLLLGCWLVLSRTTVVWAAMAITASNIVVLAARIVHDGTLSVIGVQTVRTAGAEQPREVLAETPLPTLP